jgi:hypothetical protein
MNEGNSGIVEDRGADQSHSAEKIGVNEIFKVDLTQEELKALGLLLPRGCSFHVDTKRKEKSHPKKKTPEELLLAMSEANFKPKSTHVYVPPPPPPPKKSAPKSELIP